MDELVEQFKKESADSIYLLINAISACKKENNDLANNLIQKLIAYKTIFKNFRIVIDLNLERSFFDASKTTIFMSNTNVTTFLHELGHALSYFQNHFIQPKNFNQLKQTFKNDYNRNIECIAFLDYCKQKRNNSINTIISERIETKNIKSNETAEFRQSETIYDEIVIIESIIDSLFDGKSSDIGIIAEKDSKTIALRSSKTAGHGCAYFEKTGYQYEEILANYLVLNLLFKDTDEFKLLKLVLGEELIMLLDSECNNLLTSGEENIENFQNKY